MEADPCLVVAITDPKSAVAGGCVALLPVGAKCHYVEAAEPDEHRHFSVSEHAGQQLLLEIIYQMER
jgi:hypothetical protein